MIKNYIYIGLIGLFTLSCNSSHTHTEDMESAPMEDHGDEVALTLEQAENVGIAYGKIEDRNIKSSINLIGRVELPPTGKIVVGSKLEGEILSVHIIEGQRIAKGQRVFTVQNLDLISWQEDWKKLQSRIKYLDREIARQKALSDESISPVKNYEMLLSEREQAEYTTTAIEEKLKALGITVTADSPFVSSFAVRASSEGILHDLLASKGAFITAGQELARIIDNDHLHLHLAAYSDDVVKLAVNQKLIFNVQSDPDRMMEAHIKWIDAFVNEDNNSYQVHAEIDDEKYVLPVGEFVEARVIDYEKTVKTLPAAAVTQDKGLQYIFIKEDDHEEEEGAEDDHEHNEIHFKKIQVQVGLQDLGFVEIKPVDNIPENAIVVTEGAFFLMAQSKKGEEGAGHSH